MKILHLNEHLGWYGGIETYLLSLIPRLEKLGHAQLVCFSKGEESHVAQAFRLPLLSHASRDAVAEARRALDDLLERERPDLVHIHNIHNVGAIEACFDRVPTVVTIHDYRYACPASNFFFRRTEEVCQRTCGPGCFATTLTKRCLTPRPRYAWRYYQRVRWAARHASRFSRFVAPSDYARQRFMASGFDGERIDVVPYFCPVTPREKPREIPSRPRMLFLGRMRPNKGYRYFVQSLALLPDEVEGVMVGDNSPQRQQELHQLAQQTGCNGRLRLRSWAGRDEIADLLGQTSVLVFPSVWPETLGIVGLEALASGVPVVSSDIGGVREWLIEGETGYLVPPKSPREIADAVGRLLNNPDTAEAMGRRGIRLIRERFSPEYHIEHLLQTYRKALDTSPD